MANEGGSGFLNWVVNTSTGIKALAGAAAAVITVLAAWKSLGSEPPSPQPQVQTESPEQKPVVERKNNEVVEENNPGEEARCPSTNADGKWWLKLGSKFGNADAQNFANTWKGRGCALAPCIVPEKEAPNSYAVVVGPFDRRNADKTAVEWNKMRENLGAKTDGLVMLGESLELSKCR